MVEKDDDIIDRFKDVDHSKEIKHPKTNTNSPSIKKSQNNNYDNFGFHWYPKQSSSSYGAIIGLSVFGFGLIGVAAIVWVARRYKDSEAAVLCHAVSGQTPVSSSLDQNDLHMN